jgi:hypothetical protein
VSDALVNLNRFRKDKTREDARQKADANAVKFGRTKAEKTAERFETIRKDTLLDGIKREKP